MLRYRPSSEILKDVKDAIQVFEDLPPLREPPPKRHKPSRGSKQDLKVPSKKK